MQLVLLLAFAGCSLSAGVITQTSTASAPLQFCSYFGCHAFEFIVPQFDPSQGSLNEPRGRSRIFNNITAAITIPTRSRDNPSPGTRRKAIRVTS